MDGPKTRYAVLRDGHNWDGVRTERLAAAPDGALTLASVPGPTDGSPIELPGPFDVAPSGLAVGDCDDLYLADTAAHRVVWTGGVCGERLILSANGRPGDAPGHFYAPRGLLLNPPGGLYVTDSGNGRIQVFRLPTLEVRAAWQGPLREPVGLAADSQQRVYVLDRELKRVLRFGPWGAPDDAYNDTLAAQPGLSAPAFLTISADDHLFVSDGAADTILEFDPGGHLLGALPPAESGGTFRPRALAIDGDRLYAADAGSGQIWVYDRPSGQYLGPVAGYRGPVAALAVDWGGNLWAKPGADETVVRLAADVARVPDGRLVAGPLDAGGLSEWVRVKVSADAPPGTTVRLELYASDDAADAPSEGDWLETGALDTLLPPFDPPGDERPLRRYLWLRVSLASGDAYASPRLLQIQAETAGEDYSGYLPAIYRQADADSGFLERWLALFRAELGDLERLLELMPQRFEPARTPEQLLAWLAGWLAFDLPEHWRAADQRALLLRVHEIYRQRGTRRGLQQMVELYTGVRPQIVEDFQERRLWLLGQTSTLGFDTGLAPISEQGIVVPDAQGGACPLDGAEEPPAEAWTEPEGLVVGEVVVGHSGPQAAADLGEALFADAAHRFTVLVPAALAPEPAQRRALQRLIEAEKPAHTDYHLCFVDSRMRVGFQARLGIDSIVGGPPEPMALGETVLGLGTSLGQGEGEEEVSRIGKQARLGSGLVIK